jgi:hypothetical protein
MRAGGLKLQSVAVVSGAHETGAVDLKNAAVESVELRAGPVGTIGARGAQLGVVLVDEPSAAGTPVFCRALDRHRSTCDGLAVTQLKVGTFAQGASVKERPSADDAYALFGSLRRALELAAGILERAGDRDAAGVFALRKEWRSVDSFSGALFLFATGHGKRPLWWYAGASHALYLLCIIVFWERPKGWALMETKEEAKAGALPRRWLILFVVVAFVVGLVASQQPPACTSRVIWVTYCLGTTLALAIAAGGVAGLSDARPWSRHRWFFALAVLLPSIVDVGVTLRHGDDCFWQGEKHAMRKTALLHALHVAGWFTLFLLGYAVSRQLS